MWCSVQIEWREVATVARCVRNCCGVVHRIADYTQSVRRPVDPGAGSPYHCVAREVIGALMGLSPANDRTLAVAAR
jgi:hypothetical protein